MGVLFDNTLLNKYNNIVKGQELFRIFIHFIHIVYKRFLDGGLRIGVEFEFRFNSWASPKS